MVWYELKNLRQSDSDEISAEIQVPPDSFWFSGHFPGEPILPGIAQLGMVFDAINQAKQQNLKICSISRVRFKQLIRPNDPLRVFASPRKDQTGSYNFRIMVKEELVCSGVMKIETRTGCTKEYRDIQP